MALLEFVWQGTTLAERFFAKVNKNGPIPEHRPGLGRCWVWTGYVLPSGYGFFKLPERPSYAHRAAHLMFVGPIPEGLVIDHLCRNKACANPSHLEAVTQRENLMRGDGPMSSKARQTHCIHGHEFTPENTSRKLNGTRRCRECSRIHGRARRD